MTVDPLMGAASDISPSALPANVDVINYVAVGERPCYRTGPGTFTHALITASTEPVCKYLPEVSSV